MLVASRAEVRNPSEATERGGSPTDDPEVKKAERESRSGWEKLANILEALGIAAEGLAYSFGGAGAKSRNLKIEIAAGLAAGAAKAAEIAAEQARQQADRAAEKARAEVEARDQQIRADIDKAARGDRDEGRRNAERWEQAQKLHDHC